jgi:serine/threonine protein kinase
MPSLTGQSIGRYHILEQLGEGGMAIVYKAYDTRLERNVALKVLRTDQFVPAQLQMVLQRFEREAKSLAKLKHTNIVNILDFGEHEGMPFLVMEYLPGGTLKQKLGHVIPWEEAIHTLLPVAHGLSYAHQHGVIHRDVKPANILIDQNEVPILTDFGIAKLLEGADGHTLTGSGVGIGTPEYMAPEQGIGANTIDARADIYSLGIVLYEMAAGRKPYIADTPMAVVLKQMTDPLPRPTEFAPDLPDGMERILFKALAKSPEDRYADMNAMITAMESVLTETLKIEVSIPAKPVTQKVKPSPKVVIAILGALTFILIVIFGIPRMQQRSSLTPLLGMTSTKASTVSSTNTVTPPSTATAFGTPATSEPADTFSASVLAYFAEHSPSFEDDFSMPDTDWGGTSEGFAIFNLVDGGVLTITNHTISGTTFPTNELLDAKDFALQFDFMLETDNPADSLAVQFRSREFSINRSGAWTLSDNSKSPQVRIVDGNANLQSQKNTLLIVTYNENLAIYLNNTLLYAAKDILLTDMKNRIVVMGAHDTYMDFDNFKFWNLDG